MAGGKRASMREGPLSALFKRTDVETREEREDHRPAGQREEARQPEEQREPEGRRPEQPEAELDYAQPRIPSPKERLSAAFSQDIPHDVLERPKDRPQRAYRPRDEPVITRSGVHQPGLRVVGVRRAGAN